MIRNLDESEPEEGNEYTYNRLSWRRVTDKELSLVLRKNLAIFSAQRRRGREELTLVTNFRHGVSLPAQYETSASMMLRALELESPGTLQFYGPRGEKLRTRYGLVTA